MKTILLTGATDGIGFETAKTLVSKGCNLILHGRSESKLEKAREALINVNGSAVINMIQADFSHLSDVDHMASTLLKKYSKLDVLINNAGVFKIPKATTEEGYDLRFIVNTIAPYILTKRLLPLFSKDGRVVNISSAAQSSVDLLALQGHHSLNDSDAYAQSKLALLMWSFQLAQSLSNEDPAIISLNPASFLASKMVKEAYGAGQKDLSVGADILVRAALSEEFSAASGRYFDNDIGRWSQPHQDALDSVKNEKLVATIIDVAGKLGVHVI